MGIEGKIQDTGQRGHTVSGDVKHLVCLLRGELGKARTLQSPLSKIVFYFVLVHQLQSGPFHRALIVVLVLAKRLVTVQLIVCHGQVRISNPNKRPLGSTSPLVIAGTLGQIKGRDLCRANPSARCPLCKGEDSSHRRLHLVALLSDLFLQVLWIVDPCHLVSRVFVDAEDQNSAPILVRETGQGIIEPFGTVFVSAFQLQSLRFCALFAYCLSEFQQFISKHFAHIL